MNAYSFFKYLNFCTGFIRKRISFEEWCYLADACNRQLQNKYGISWEKDHWLREVIEHYYKSGYSPDSVTEKDYKEAKILDSKFEDTNYDYSILEEYDPPEDDEDRRFR